ncbi:MAG: isoaspartyl peptidase/L-asparaginase, partial [Bacteroidota bacterium]
SNSSILFVSESSSGRVGDSSIIGCGCFAENQSCAVSATGYGEFFIRSVVAHDIAALVKYKGLSLQQAADEVIHKKLVNLGGEGGVITVDRDANIVLSFNSEGMYRGWLTSDEKAQVAIFKNVY